MTARLGWFKTLPQDASFLATDLNQTSQYDNFYSGVDPSEFIIQPAWYCAVNNDTTGGPTGGTVVWTRTWVPTTTAAAPLSDEPFGAGYGVLRVCSSVTGNAFAAYVAGTLTITATLNGVAVPGYLTLALSNTVDGSYGGAAWSNSLPGTLVDFVGTPLIGYAPMAVQFTDLSAPVPTAWAWTFGDGGVSTVRNPLHVYLGPPGQYTVSLTVTP